MKGYKGFNKDMTCNGVQFKEGEIYKTDKAVICQSGFHFCENPLDILQYYNIVGSEFHEVEATGEIVNHNEDTKHATTEIKIGAKLSMQTFIEASLDFIFSICKPTDKTAATTGYKSVAATTGNNSAAATTGNNSAAATTGDSSAAATTGDSSAAATTGYRSAAATTGNSSAAATTGNSSAAATTGDNSVAATTGYKSAAATTGYKSAAATTGNSSAAATTGNSSAAATTGDNSAAATTGDNSIAAALGINSQAKSKKGNWIVLAEWVRDKNCLWVIKSVKTIKIDGKKIKEDTFYELKKGEFVEVK